MSDRAANGAPGAVRRRRGATAALIGLALLLPLLSPITRQAAFTIQAEALAARLDGHLPIWASSSTRSHGPADAELQFAALLLEHVVDGGQTATLEPDARERLDRLAASGTRLIPDWSGGRHTVHLEIHSTPVPVTLADDGQGGRWPDPGEVATLIEGLFAGRVPDAVLVLWSDGELEAAGAAGLTSQLSAFGRQLPVVAIVDPGSRLDRDTYPGEILVHEFGHVLEIRSEAAGEHRPNLHHPEHYGFREEGGSYQAWYRFFFAHPTETIADAAGRAPLPTPAASTRPLAGPRTMLSWRP